MIGHTQDGIWMLGRFSVGWNFYKTRTHSTIALPLVVSYINIDDDGGKRWLIVVGPITFVWLVG